MLRIRKHMNHIIKTKCTALVLSILVIGLSNCSDSAVFNNEEIILKGNVANSSFNKISLQYDDELFFSVIDSKGDYEFNIDSKIPLFMRLQLGELGLPLYSEPGKVDSISCNKSFSESLKIQGDNSHINQYLLSKVKMYDKVLSKLPKLYKLEAMAFSLEIDNIFAGYNNDLDSLANSYKNISKKFLELESAQLLYKRAELKLSYSGGHKYFAKLEKVELPSTYNKYLQKLNLNNSKLLPSREYVSFLHSYLKQETRKRQINNSASKKDFELAKLNLVPTLFADGQIQEKLLFDIIKKNLARNRNKDISELIISYESLSHSTQNKEKVKELYSMWKELTKGSPAPQFSYTDIKGNKVSLNDFKGKFVCVDVWATWCLPCKKEFPLIKEMIEKYKDKNIVFISISVDEDKKIWEKAIEDYSLEGVQLLADEGWQSSIIENYNIHSIPRFILIDTMGNIVNVNANYPSNDLSKQIEELLK